MSDRLTRVARMNAFSMVAYYDPREVAVATWTIGKVTVTRIEEQLGFASRSPEQYLDGFDRETLAQHLDWLVPHHYSSDHDRLITSIHSWLIRTDRHTILLDSCAGNHKNRPGFSRFHQLDTPFLQRLRGAGAPPDCGPDRRSRSRCARTGTLRSERSVPSAPPPASYSSRRDRRADACTGRCRSLPVARRPRAAAAETAYRAGEIGKSLGGFCGFRHSYRAG